MTCSILVGGAWGDEGKGKCITYLCDTDKPDIIARAGPLQVLYILVPNS